MSAPSVASHGGRSAHIKQAACVSATIVAMSSPPVFSYDSIADVYAARVDSAPYNALYERPAMLSLLPPVVGARVLDAGCGSGWYAATLAARGAAVTAIDASTAMIAYARARFAVSPADALASHVDIRIADLQRPLSFLADGTCDGIVCSLVLHYLRDWDATLAEFRRILAPGGWLLCSTHHPMADAVRLDTLRYHDIEWVEDSWKWVGRVCYYRRSMSAIVNALTGADFAIDRLDEPLPTDEFRNARPDSYARLMKRPEFLMVSARAMP